MLYDTVSYYNNDIDDYQKIYLPEKQYITSNIVDKYVNTIIQIKRDMLNNYNPVLWDQIDYDSSKDKKEQTEFIKFVQRQSGGGYTYMPIELYIIKQYCKLIKNKSN